MWHLKELEVVSTFPIIKKQKVNDNDSQLYNHCIYYKADRNKKPINTSFCLCTMIFKKELRKLKAQ
jgi:hypothetical protein